MTKAVCQECGKELSSWAEKHTIQDCGDYHLKRAQEILSFNLNQIKQACEDHANTSQQLFYDNGQLEGQKNCFEHCYKELEAKIAEANRVLADFATIDFSDLDQSAQLAIGSLEDKMREILSQEKSIDGDKPT